jgi:hypothetical protein
MYEFTKKDLVSSGDLITTWAPDYEEFDIDMDSSISQALLHYDGNYYIAEVSNENNEAVFPDDQALILDIEYERINTTFIWDQIKDFIPDEDLGVWDDLPFDDEDLDWENDSE